MPSSLAIYGWNQSLVWKDVAVNQNDGITPSEALQLAFNDLNLDFSTMTPEELDRVIAYLEANHPEQTALISKLKQLSAEWKNRLGSSISGTGLENAAINGYFICMVLAEVDPTQTNPEIQQFLAEHQTDARMLFHAIPNLFQTTTVWDSNGGADAVEQYKVLRVVLQMLEASGVDMKKYGLDTLLKRIDSALIRYDKEIERIDASSMSDEEKFAAKEKALSQLRADVSAVRLEFFETNHVEPNNSLVVTEQGVWDTQQIWQKNIDTGWDYNMIPKLTDFSLQGLRDYRDMLQNVYLPMAVKSGDPVAIDYVKNLINATEHALEGGFAEGGVLNMTFIGVEFSITGKTLTLAVKKDLIEKAKVSGNTELVERLQAEQSQISTAIQKLLEFVKMLAEKSQSLIV